MKRLYFIIVLSSLLHTLSLSTAEYNFLAVMSANNNLYRYALQDIKEMQRVGTNENINIFVQIDNFGKKEVSWYRIEKGRSVLLAVKKIPPESLSGTPENLFAFAKEIVTNYPAKRLVIDVWNHGSGVKDPHIWSKYLPYDREECFYFNPETKLYEINRSLFTTTPFLGVAFNDIGHVYLDNQDLEKALKKISNELLGGKKIDIVAFDACHQGMIEIAYLLMDSADYTAFSEEIVPGAGWDYTKVLSPFLTRSLSPKDFAKHIVKAYDERYNHIFADLTHSAAELKYLDSLVKNVDKVSTTLLNLLQNDPEQKFFRLLSKIRRSPNLTTAFLDSDYIDLAHFYKSLRAKIQELKENSKYQELEALLTQGLNTLSTVIIKNATGPNVRHAGGLAIYYPTKTLHSSYLKTSFAKDTNWCNFLYAFIKQKRANVFGKIHETEIIAPETA